MEEMKQTKRKSSFGRKESDIEQKILGIRRVVRVVKGGRRFSFSVVIVTGDKKGSVGLGTGKATDTALAIGKALRKAQKNMRKIVITKDMSIPYEVDAKFCSSRVSLIPNKEKGLVSGGSVRDILILAGIKNVSSKLLSRSKNKLNNAQATLKALEKIKIIHANTSIKKETSK